MEGMAGSGMAATAGFSMAHVDIARDIHDHAYNVVDAAYADTRWERVRGALFTDWQPPPHARNTMVHRLAEPARGIRRALEALIALQKESDGTHSLEDLLALLRSSDSETVARAVKHVYAVSRHDGSLAHKDIVDALLKASKSGDPEVERLAVGALSHLSENKEGRVFLFRSGGLAEIIRMLGSHDESIVRYALTTLHRLLQHIVETRPHARQLQATRALLPLLGGSDGRMLALATDAVYLLIHDDAMERQRFTMEMDGARRMIRLLTTFEDQPKVVYTAVRCVRALSAGQDATALKHTLIEKDALIVLYSNLVRTQDARTRLAILACLRNLSDAVSNEQDHSALVIVLLDIIRDSALAGTPQGHTEDEVMYAAGVLSNLTCNNVNNKAAVFESNGVGTLVDALRLRPTASDETVTEPALCALRHCTARHVHAAHAQRALVRVGGWPMLVEQLRTLRPPVAKAALGVARNAALLQENRAALVDSPDGLGERLAAVTVEILTSAAAELRIDVRAQSDDGVTMWELAEAAAGSLHQLAAHPTISSWLLHSDHSLLQIVKEIIESDEAAAADEVMQRELLGLLYQLSKCDEGIAQMEAIQMAAPVERCLRSPHPSVTTYAAGVLNNLQSGRGSHYQDVTDTAAHGYGNPNWEGGRAAGGTMGMAAASSEYHVMGSELGEGYEPELFGYQNQGLGGDNYGLDRIDHSFRMPHNNSDWFDTDL